MNESTSIADLMAESGVGFGTSGARGLVDAMSDRVCYLYTRGFLQYLRSQMDIAPGDRVVIAGDLRVSTPRIMAACAKAIQDGGYQPINCGFVPTPAIALYAMGRGLASLMVTGSHIPDDRNGIKFYRPTGEILKRDESGIKQQAVSFDSEAFDVRGALISPFEPPAVESQAVTEFRDRYLGVFPDGCLAGTRIGVYEHSSVVRDLLGDIFERLGATVIRLGRANGFVPVDTEAVREEDIRLARDWAAEHRLDALVSTDGDGDRPLVADERGVWMRGDVAGVLCARLLGVRNLVTPISSNTLVEKCAWFENVVRTRIGSPYVIDAMDKLLAAGRRKVAGYEANGGFLTGDTLELNGKTIAPLPTRDAVIVALGVVILARKQRLPLSGLLQLLPGRYTHSGRLKDFPSELSRQRIAELTGKDMNQASDRIERLFGSDFGRLCSVDRTDGLRMVFENDEIVHLRPSGNAPELRCYNEAGSPERAAETNRICLSILEGWRR